MTIIVKKTSAIHDFNSLQRVDYIPIKTKYNYSKTWLVVLIASLIISILILWPQAAKLTTTANQTILIDTERIIELSNFEREKESLGNIRFNPELMKLAKIRAEDMKNKNYFDHFDPDGNGLKYFLKQIDYNYLIVGENLAINFKNNDRVITAWMNSETHRQNIMNPLFDEIGVYQDTIKTKNGDRPIIVMILGKKLN